MFSCIPLLDAFARVADPSEWEEFKRLAPPKDADYWLLSMTDRFSARDLAVLRYRDLWAKFVQSVREKLIAGEWVADGFNPQFGSRPVPIDARLWKSLDIAPGHDEAEGEGFRFVHLSISQVRPQARLEQAAHVDLRRELIRYVEDVGRLTTVRMTMPEVRGAARRAFNGTAFTDNMFKEAWRAAKRPPLLRQSGRPKLKGER